MKYFDLTMDNGESVRMPVTDEGHPVCPICGYAWPSYVQDGAELPWQQPAGAQTAFSTGGSCRDCGVTYGYEDAPGPNGSYHEQWASLRAKWLDSVGWSADAANRVRERLGVEPQKPGE